MTAPTNAETIAALAGALNTTPADLLELAVESVRAPTETPTKDELYARAFDDVDANLSHEECEEWAESMHKAMTPETPSLTTEQARGLAARWAFWHAGLKQCADNAEFDREMTKAPMLLADPEREQLFAWVRARMAVLAPDRPDHVTVELSYYIALDLDLPLESIGPPMALCKAARGSSMSARTPSLTTEQ